jgi:phage terminase small subunit
MPCRVHFLLPAWLFCWKVVIVMAKMTAKQKRFCDEYLTDLNATQAAIRSGYSEKTAYSIGNENLKKPELKKYIEERMAEKEAELIAKQDEVMKYLTSVMRREKTESVVVTLQEEKSLFAPDANGTMRKQTVKQTVPKVVEIPAMIKDSNKAAELLGKAYGIYTDKIETDVDMELNISIDYGDEEDE